MVGYPRSSYPPTPSSLREEDRGGRGRVRGWFRGGVRGFRRRVRGGVRERGYD